jgi:hypothetical protein
MFFLSRTYSNPFFFPAALLPLEKERAKARSQFS